ncbi:hypothetical protein [Shinella zoogloeoides]|uniref:hypothetical protein n=1 Tax=Shinella zoogloeoides TaxID=352475 RepID=UPI003D7C1845
MKFKYIAAALAAAVATSCAKRPDAIVPADIPMAAYAGQTCPALQTELAKEKAALSAVSKQQYVAENGDAFGVFDRLANVEHIWRRQGGQAAAAKD